MDGMALGADYRIHCVRRAADICFGEILGVTAQAGIQDLLRLQKREGANGCFAAMRIYVSFPWAVASFASCVLRRFLTGGDTSEMRVLVERKPNVGMARAAYRAPDELVLCNWSVDLLAVC